MKRWFTATVTRGEVIGWALAIPVVLSIWGFGTITVRFLPDASSMVDRHPDLTPEFLRACVSIGVAGVVGIYSLCGLLALGAQLSKQRLLVRLAAPVIGYVLAYAVNAQFFASWLELCKQVPTAEGQAVLDRMHR